MRKSFTICTGTSCLGNDNGFILLLMNIPLDMIMFYIKNQPQHLIQRSNNREIIFGADEDYQFYFEYLEEA